MDKEINIRKITIEYYDALYSLWSSTEQSLRALNPVDDSREGIERYLKRNPNTCFAAVSDGQIVGAILTGHDGRRAAAGYLFKLVQVQFHKFSHDDSSFGSALCVPDSGAVPFDGSIIPARPSHKRHMQAPWRPGGRRYTGLRRLYQ